jgi:hypothetical protein
MQSLTRNITARVPKLFTREAQPNACLAAVPT